LGPIRKLLRKGPRSPFALGFTITGLAVVAAYRLCSVCFPLLIYGLIDTTGYPIGAVCEGFLPAPGRVCWFSSDRSWEPSMIWYHFQSQPDPLYPFLVVFFMVLVTVPVTLMQLGVALGGGLLMRRFAGSALGRTIALRPMTMRRWMSLIAVVALMCGGILETTRVRDRRKLYQDRLSFHACRAGDWNTRARISQEQIRSAEETVSKLKALRDRGEFRCEESLWDDWRQVIDSALNLVREGCEREEYHREWQRRYEWALLYPWRTVPPEPPEVVPVPSISRLPTPL
jgi:hypothetical protein